MDLSDDAAVERFRAYLRMRTVHPDPTPGYAQAVPFLRAAAEAAGLGFRCVELAAGHPLCVVTWPGTDTSLPSVIMNSHMDVVPADAARWTHDPWGGALADGKVWGRGAQDMKSVGCQYLEAVMRLKASGGAYARTLHLLYVPGERDTRAQRSAYHAEAVCMACTPPVGLCVRAQARGILRRFGR